MSKQSDERGCEQDKNHLNQWIFKDDKYLSRIYENKQKYQVEK